MPGDRGMKNPRRITRRQLEETCYHEAGHVVVSRVLGGTVLEVSVGAAQHPVKATNPSIPADVGAYEDGRTVRNPLANLADHLVVCLAGVEAEFTLLQGHTPSESDRDESDGGDRVLIINLVIVLEREGGNVDDILAISVRRARDLVLDHAADIRKVARALMKRRRLTEDDLDALLGPMPRHNEMETVEWIAMLQAKGVQFDFQ
jgi:hypothetical protein